MIRSVFIAQLLSIAGFALAPAPAPPPMPWKPGTEYRFQWRYDGTSVGITLFRIEDGKGDVLSGRRVGWRTRASLDYSRPGTRLRGEFLTDYDPDWRPILYRRQFSASVGGFNGGESIEARFDKSGVEIVTQQGKSQVKESHALDEPVYLCGAQAMEHWAIFLSRMPRPAPPGFRIPTYQPETGSLPIELSAPSEERIAGVRCTAYSFRSTGFEGRIWVDEEGRLRRYVQGKLEITLSVE